MRSTFPHGALARLMTKSRECIDYMVKPQPLLPVGEFMLTARKVPLFASPPMRSTSRISSPTPVMPTAGSKVPRHWSPVVTNRDGQPRVTKRESDRCRECGRSSRWRSATSFEGLSRNTNCTRRSSRRSGPFFRCQTFLWSASRPRKRAISKMAIRASPYRVDRTPHHGPRLFIQPVRRS